MLEKRAMPHENPEEETLKNIRHCQNAPLCFIVCVSQYKIEHITKTKNKILTVLIINYQRHFPII